MVEYHALFDKLEGLTDLEAAVLLCIVAREHCIVDTERDAIEDLENELKLVAENVFGLSYAAICCSPNMSLEEFNHAILSPDRRNASPSGPKPKSVLGCSYGTSQVANVIITRDLDQAPEEIQLHVLEIMRSRKLPSRHGNFSTPNAFVLIPLLSADRRFLSTLLNKHLIDQIFISHYHDPKSGFTNLEDDSWWLADDQSSVSSTNRNVYLTPGSFPDSRLIQNEDVQILRQLVDSVTVSPDMNGYLHDIIVFLRLARSVTSGVTASATRHFQLLSRCLAPFQHMDYVCPALVAAAARKIYRHRIVISRPEDDRSILYGSTFKTARLLLTDATAENTIESVLSQVEVPM